MQILNMHTLKCLLGWMQVSDLLELMNALLHELPKDCQQLQFEIGQADLQNIKKQAHRIKGAYSNLGCDALCNTMQRLEAVPEAVLNDASLRSHIANQFQQTHDALCAFLEALSEPKNH